MKKIQFGIFAMLSVAAALYVGLIDYETKSVWQLFNAENFPFMVFFSILVFGLLNLIAWGLSKTTQKLAKLLS
ncbi:MAG: hypothetical protein KIH69_023015 [Anaerolineae bacterium]|nr:hypothetical protein [Anaerolineae bacterium]